MGYKLSQHIDWTQVQPSRAGIIVYTYDRGRLLFALGQDSLYGDLTDFGGGVKRSDGNALNGAAREFMEETLYAFGPVDPNHLNLSLAIYDDQTIIFFYYLRVDPDQVSRTFRLRREVLTSSEISDIKWLTIPELRQAVANHRVYSKVADLLISNQLLI